MEMWFPRTALLFGIAGRLFAQLDKFDNFSSSDVTITKQERLLNLLSMVRFNNALCRGIDGRSGVCIPATECTQNRGTSNGRCAQGFGVCCVVEASCGDNIRVNNTFFVNPGHPRGVSHSVSCAVNVQRVSENICQMRLDFESFQLDSTSNGLCSNDAFLVSGQEANFEIPSICGLNDKQHMYIHLSRDTNNPVTLLMTTSDGVERKWKIRVTQLDCGNANSAPAGCLQYFTGGSGTFRSFNFDSPIPEAAGGQSNYMSGINYAICIRRESGFCGVQYRPFDDSLGNFDLDPGLAQDQFSSTDSLCNHDSLTVPGASNALDNGLPNTNQPPASRFCGCRLNSIPHLLFDNPSGIISILPGGIQVIFSTDHNPPAPNRYDRGFYLRYQQRPCSFLQTMRRRFRPETSFELKYEHANKANPTAPKRTNTPPAEITSRISKIMPLESQHDTSKKKIGRPPRS